MELPSSARILRSRVPRLVLSCAAAFAWASSARAEDTRTYADVPRVTATDPAFFRGVFQTASKSILRVALFGDSQETSPNGAGRHYIAFLNARFAKVFGPATETVFYSNVNAANPPQWLSGTLASAAFAPPTLPPDQTLPNVVVHALLAGSGATGDWQRTIFLHDAARTLDPLLTNGPWFEQQGPYVAEVLAIRRKGAPGLQWRNRPTDLDFHDDPAATVQGGTLAFSPKAPIDGFSWLSTPPLSFDGKRHLQLELRGASATVGQEVAGLRFRSLAASRGVSVLSIARGGMRLGDILGQYPNSGAMLRALGPRVAMIQLGANDAGYVPTRAEWRANLVATIAWIRAQMGDPQFPIILAGELRAGPTPAAYTVVDWMPVIAHDLAMSDPRLVAVNLRRVTEEEYGWVRWSMRYMQDTAHFMPYAQRLESEALVGELTRTLSIPDPGCTSPAWADCVRTWGSVCLEGGCAPIIDVEASLFNIDWNGPGSTCADLDGDGLPDACPPLGLGDINRDGFINGMDLAILLADWGRPGSPADLDGNGEVGAQDLAILLGAWNN